MALKDTLLRFFRFGTAAASAVPENAPTTPSEGRIWRIGTWVPFAEAHLRDKRLILSLMHLPHPNTIRCYMMMLDDPVIWGVQQAMRNLIQRTSFRIVPHDADDAAAAAWAEWVDECVFGDEGRRADLLGDLWTGMLLGFAPFQLAEWTHDEAGRWYPSEVRFENPFWFIYYPAFRQWRVYTHAVDERGTPTPSWGLQILDDPWQFAFFVNDAWYHPYYGRALLHPLRRAWFIRRFALDAWFVAMERTGIPWRIIRVPATWSDDDRQALFQAVRDVHLDTVVLLEADPAATDLPSITFESPGALRSALFADAMRELRQEIVHAIVGPSLQFLEPEYGTRAAAQTHKEILMDILAGLQKRFASFILREIVGRVTAANYADPDAFRLGVEWDPPEAQDVEEALNVWSSLVARGVPVSMRWTAERFGVELAQDEADAVPGAPRATLFPGP